MTTTDKPDPGAKQAEKSDDKWCWTRISEVRRKYPKEGYKRWSETMQILLESCCAIVMFVLNILVGLVFITLGIVYLNECSASRLIPVIAIIFGAFSLTHGVFVTLVRIKLCSMTDPKDGFGNLAKVVLCVTSFGTVICLCIACVAIYSISDSVNTKPEAKKADPHHYCNRFFYWFSFSFVTLYMIMVTIILLIICCLCCFIVANEVEMDSTPHTIVIIKEKERPKNAN